jgi:hypothetical protein
VGPTRVPQAGMEGVGEKNAPFLQNALQNYDFSVLYSASTLSTPKTYDVWVRCDGYGRSGLSEKNFQLSSLHSIDR